MEKFTHKYNIGSAAWFAAKRRKRRDKKVIRDRLKESIKREQSNRCLICKRFCKLTMHHLVPRNQGGAWTLDNLIGLCNRCHKHIHLAPEATQ